MSALNDSSKAGSTDQSDSVEPAFDVPARLSPSTAIWLVRHGETEWSHSGQHTGRTDIPLTELGERQARAVRPGLERFHPARVLSSPRQRALRTAELAGLSVDAVDPDLCEWDYG